MTMATATSLPALVEAVAGVPVSDERRQARVRRIVEVATALFLRHGFHGTGIRMIAREAHVSMGNIYQYIRQKEDLVGYILAFVIEDLEEHLPNLPAGAPVRERIAMFFEEWFDVINRHRDALEMLQREQPNMPQDMRHAIHTMSTMVEEQLAGLIREGIATGEIEPCDARLLALDVHYLADIWAYRRHVFTDYTDIDYVRSVQTEIVLRMIPFKSSRCVSTEQSAGDSLKQ